MYCKNLIIIDKKEKAEVVNRAGVYDIKPPYKVVENPDSTAVYHEDGVVVANSKNDLKSMTNQEYKVKLAALKKKQYPKKQTFKNLIFNLLKN